MPFKNSMLDDSDATFSTNYESLMAQNIQDKNVTCTTHVDKVYPKQVGWTMGLFTP